MSFAACATVALPFVLRSMIRFIESGPTGAYGDRFVLSQPETWLVGAGWALVLFLISFGTLWITNQGTASANHISVEIDSILVGAIFAKTLRLSVVGRAKFGQGSITTIVSADAFTIMYMLPRVVAMVGVLFQLALVMVVLFLYLSWQFVWPGAVVLLAMFFLNMFIGSSFGILQKRRLATLTERISFLQDTLSGIRLVKSMGWEDIFIGRILTARAAELKVTRNVTLTMGLVQLSLELAPIVSSLAIIWRYAFYARELTAENVYVTFSFMGIISIPLFMVPMLLVFYKSLSVSLGRIQALLNAPEDAEEAAVDGDTLADSAVAVRLTHANFAWAAKKAVKPPAGLDPASRKAMKALNKAKKEALRAPAKLVPVLFDLVCDFPRNKLTFVVGEVGSGKSSLCSAIARELLPTSGAMERQGSLAYVSQNPYIVTGSIRYNIIGERPFDQARFDRAVAVCSLENDLAVLADGEHTDIGERGINLSGGQKARVALARAFYNGGDCFVFDSPLSAVDAEVGEHLFNELLTGELGNKTRIVVTSQLQFLRRGDYIVLMLNGRIAEHGTYCRLRSAVYRRQVVLTPCSCHFFLPCSSYSGFVALSSRHRPPTHHPDPIYSTVSSWRAATSSTTSCRSSAATTARGRRRRRRCASASPKTRASTPQCRPTSTCWPRGRLERCRRWLPRPSPRRLGVPPASCTRMRTA